MAGLGVDRLARRLLTQSQALTVPAMLAADAPTLADTFTARTIAHACGLDLDPWQLGVVTSDARQQLLLCSRQSGKSTVAALVALREVLTVPGSLVLLISPTQRQSADLHRTVMQLLRRLYADDAEGLLPTITAESGMRLELSTGARVVALPGSESSTRGYAACTLVVIDEAARVLDEILAAVLPTLATTNGRIIALSTPRGKRGWFYLEYASGSQDWQRTTITADDCQRISREFLEGQKRLLGPHRFAEEFYNVFYDPAASVFSSELVARCFTDHSVTPLWVA